jgi:(+)-trans-carveol dehydrogenase
MSGRLAGKVALVTGAARGQGRSHAIALAREGADIIAIDICEQIDSAPYALATPEDLRLTVSEVESLGRRVVASELDIRDLAQLAGVVDAGVAELGRLDIVSANAGISSPAGLAHEISEQSWEDMVGVNLTGVRHTARVATPHILKGGLGGSITITGSISGQHAYHHIAHYAAAEHGVVGLTRAVASELAPESVRVNAIVPGQVNTSILLNEQTYGVSLPDRDDPNLSDFAAASLKLDAVPVPWVESIDASNLLVFLASEEARYITGAVIPIDTDFLLS